MTNPADLEAIFAEIGLLPILRAKPRLGKGKLARAADQAKTLRQRMAKFLGADAFDEARDLPEFDYQEVVRLVSGGQTPAQIAALHAAVPEPELAADLLVMAGKLQTWAASIVPRETHTGFQALIVEEPDDSSLADFRRVWAVACDPMTVMGDLEDGSLSEDQAAACALLFPATYAEMSQAVTDAAAQLAARRGKDWQPSPTKAALIGVLRQQDTVDIGLLVDVQAMFAGEEAQEQAALQAQQRGGRGGGAATAPQPIEPTPGQDAAAG